MAEIHVRKAAFSGSFYPADPQELDDLIREYIAYCPDRDFSLISGVVVPHAGYVYSGEVAGCGYGVLKRSLSSKRASKKVFLLGAAHQVIVKGIGVSNAEQWETPLGNVSVSGTAREMADREDLCNISEDAHASEHSLEVQLPFLQVVMNQEFEIVPLLVSDVNYQEAASVLEKFIGSEDLLVVSTDLSHYRSYTSAADTDRKTIDTLLSLDTVRMLKEGDACGRVPLAILMELSGRRGWKMREVCYRNSGDTSGSKDAVVGYVSLIVHR